MKLIKIYGARRTGTNYVGIILSNMFECVELRDGRIFGGKHNEPTEMMDLLVKNHEDVEFVVCIKNPKAWLASMCKWLGKDPDESFIRYLLRIYNKKYGTWLDFIDSNYLKGYLFIWESTMTKFDLRNQLNRMKINLNLEKQGSYNPFINRTVKPNRKFGIRNFDRKYYINREYLKFLGDSLCGIVDEMTEEILIRLKGYYDYNLFKKYYGDF